MQLSRSHTKKIEKQAIAVYDPADPWEQAIQQASKSLTGDWLPSHPCQLLARATAALKIGTDWLDHEDLMPVRANYFFHPQLIKNSQDLVFATHLLFLRDILENEEINLQIHDPIAFIAPLLANFLFRNRPVHIVVNADLLRSVNRKADFLGVGGFLISQEGNVSVPKRVITDIMYHRHSRPEDAKKLVNIIQDETGMHLKAAASEVDFEIYKIDEHFQDLRAGMPVWDKQKREPGNLLEIDPGEVGVVRMRYESGQEYSIPKDEFDKRFIII